MLNRPNKKYIILNTWQKYIIIKNTLWHLMLNCCESRVAVSAPCGKREKWNRPRVLHIIDTYIIYQWLKWTFPIMGELNMLPIVTSTIWKLGMNAIKRGWKLEKCKNVLIQEHYKIYNIIIYKRGWMVKKKGNQHISMKWCCIMFIVDHIRREKEREVREKWCVLGTKKSRRQFEKVLGFGFVWD
jgi:hypothetical protein